MHAYRCPLSVCTTSTWLHSEAQFIILFSSLAIRMIFVWARFAKCVLLAASASTVVDRSKQRNILRASSIRYNLCIGLICASMDCVVNVSRYSAMDVRTRRKFLVAISTKMKTKREKQKLFLVRHPLQANSIFHIVKGKCEWRDLIWTRKPELDTVIETKNYTKRAEKI